MKIYFESNDPLEKEISFYFSNTCHFLKMLLFILFTLSNSYIIDNGDDSHYRFRYIRRALYISFPYIGLLIDGKELKSIIETDYTKSQLMKALNMDDKQWEDIAGIVSSINDNMKLGAIMNMDKEIEEAVNGIYETLEGVISYKDIKIKEEITSDNVYEVFNDFLDNWESVSNIPKAFSLKQDNIKNALALLKECKKTDKTFGDLLKTVGIDLDYLVKEIKAISNLANGKTKVFDIIKYSGIDESLIKETVELLNNVFESEKINKEETQKLIKNMIKIILNAISKATSFAIERVINTIKGAFNTKDTISFSDRSLYISKGADAIISTVKPDKGSPGYKDLTIISECFLNLSKDGFNIYDLLRKYLDVSEDGIEKLNNILDNVINFTKGEGSVYKLVNFTLTMLTEQDLDNYIGFLKDSKFTLKDFINEIFKTSDIVINFLKTGEALNKDGNSIVDLPIFKYNLGDYDSSVDWKELFSSIKSVLVNTSKLNQYISFYNEDKQLIEMNETGVSTILSKAYQNILNQLDSGKSFKDAFTNSLKEIKVEDVKDIIEELLSFMEKVISEYPEADTEKAKARIEEFNEAINTSTTMFDLYEKCRKIDVEEFINAIRGLGHKFNILFNERINLSKITTSTLYKELSKDVKLMQYSPLADILEIFNPEVGHNVKKQFNLFHTIASFLINGTIKSYTTYGDYDNYFEDKKLQILKELSDALKQNSFQPFCNFNLQLVLSIFEELDKYVSSLNNLIVRIVSFPMIKLTYKVLYACKNHKMEEFTNMFCKGLNLKATANLIDEYIKYSETIINGSSVYDILKKNHGLDVEGIIAPVKDAIVAIDNSMYTDKSIEKARKYVEAFEFYQKADKEDAIKRFFNCDCSLATAYINIFEMFFKGNFSKVSDEEAKKYLRNDIENITAFDDLVSHNFSFKYIIDSSNMFFKTMFQEIAKKYVPGKQLIDSLEGIVMNGIDIHQTATNIENYSSVDTFGVKELGNMLKQTNNENAIVSLCAKANDTKPVTFSDISKKTGLNFAQTADALTNNVYDFTSLLPTSNSLLCKNNAAAVSELTTSVKSG